MQTYNCTWRFNTLTLDEDSGVVGHVNHIDFVVKDLSIAGNTIPGNIQVMQSLYVDDMLFGSNDIGMMSKQMPLIKNLK